MKYLKEWLQRLRSRPVSGDYWEDRRHHEALEALADCKGEGDWLTLSCHGNGFVREVAVRELSELPSPDALAALLERVNDWVPQVRQLANAGLQRYFTSEQAPALLHALQPLMALAERQRADHGQTLGAARTVLQGTEVRDAVLTAFLAQQGKSARFLFDLLLEASDEPTELLGKALAHREMTVRQMAVSACQKLPVEQAVPLLQHALATPGASVRVKALHALLSKLDDPREMLRGALLDASPAVRSLARWAAPRWQLDAREVLAKRLDAALPTSKREWLGVLGLASELQVSLDERWRAAALRSPMASVRLAALMSPGDEYLSEQLVMLDDPADKVFAKACERLSCQPWDALQAELDGRLDRDWQSLPDHRRAALMALRPRWQQLAYLLRRLDSDIQQRDYWLVWIANWCQQQYLMVDPSTAPAERRRLLAWVSELQDSGALPPGCVTRLT
ncbi:HEAT repeat domain-containing protein [Pseudomonas sp. CNPSo 3701]|uniref:HEAT repeat domain-containing protein n=1 Tax=Pseudomonas sp. CNPSo 3701 TaxID=3027943 RepID=UPI002364A06D|nr:PBS lyase [Pseudomonas sp. CNPSo 3701]MDD1506842.1 PBS lyase [Pseudomonas sp. CNPSo 3701]